MSEELIWVDMFKCLNEIDNKNQLKCIKCKKLFFSKNYNGSKPLCKLHLYSLKKL